MKISDVKKKSVAIVTFTTPDQFVYAAPGKYFQVTIDPGKLSPDGNFIRFGNNGGDELLGWQPSQWIEVCEVLGEWDSEKPPTLFYRGVTVPSS